MFDIGFSEILVIVVVALVVVGPEKMPKVARTLGHLWGRSQRYMGQVKREIAADIKLEELRELESKAKAGIAMAEKSARETSSSIENDMRELERELDQSTADLGAEQKRPTRKSLAE